MNLSSLFCGLLIHIGFIEPLGKLLFLAIIAEASDKHMSKVLNSGVDHLLEGIIIELLIDDFSQVIDVHDKVYCIID